MDSKKPHPTAPPTTRGESRSRRSFLSACTLAGLGPFAAGAFFASCGRGGKEEKTVPPVAEPAKAYLEKVLALLAAVHEREFPAIETAARLAVQAKLEGYNLYAWMIGGMLAGETRENRPGLPLIYRTTGIDSAVRYDFVVTNDPYTVKGFSERLIRIIGITKPSILSNETPPGSLENMGTFRIEDVTDTVIYSHVPPEDGILSLPGADAPIGPASGIVETFLFHALTAEIAELLFTEGIFPRIG